MTIRIGVLANSQIPKYHIKALEKAVERTDVVITLVIVNDQDPPETTDHIINAFRNSLWDKYYKISWKLNPPELKQNRSVEDVSLFSDARFHYCQPKPADDIGSVFPQEAVELAKEYCDLLFRSGFGIIKGDILNVTEYGVLSYHHGDIREYRGKPAGFWEYMNDEEVAGVSLQRLNETLDGGEIIVFKEVNISGLGTWPEVRDELFNASVGMIETAIETYTSSSFEPMEIDELGDLYTNPTNREMIRFLIKNEYGYIKTRFL